MGAMELSAVGFLPIQVWPDQMMNFVTKEVVDEVFINLPSEDYNISDFVIGVW